MTRRPFRLAASSICLCLACLFKSISRWARCASMRAPIPAGTARINALIVVGVSAITARPCEGGFHQNYDFGGCRRVSRTNCACECWRYLSFATLGSIMRFQLKRDTALGNSTMPCCARSWLPKACWPALGVPGINQAGLGTSSGCRM